MSNIKMLKFLCLTLLMIIGGLSCAGIESGKGVNRLERLQERATGLIEARKKMSLDEMRLYYLEPQQARIGNIIFQDGKIETIEIADGEQAAQVKIKVKMQAMGFTFNDVPQTQAWVWATGDWYFDPVKPVHNTPFNSKKDKTSKVEDEKDKK